MGIERWERWGLLAGPAFAVTLIVSALIPGQPPDLDASGAEVREYFIDNASPVKAGMLLAAIAAVLGLWWIAALWRAMTKAEFGKSHLALIAALGFLGGGVLAGVNQAILAANAIVADGLTPELARYTWVTSNTVFGVAAYMFCVMSLATGVLIVRQHFVADWIGYFSLAMGAGWAVAGGLIASTASWLMPVTFLTFLGMMVWVVALSASLWREQSPIDLRGTAGVETSATALSMH